MEALLFFETIPKSDLTPVIVLDTDASINDEVEEVPKRKDPDTDSSFLINYNSNKKKRVQNIKNFYFKEMSTEFKVTNDFKKQYKIKNAYSSEKACKKLN